MCGLLHTILGVKLEYIDFFKIVHHLINDEVDAGGLDVPGGLGQEAPVAPAEPALGVQATKAG